MKIGFISDIHEDIESLNHAFKIFKNEKVNKIICLGDILGFSSKYYDNYYDTKNGEKCIESVKKNCLTTVAGNHDLHAIKKIPKNCTKFNYPKNWYTFSSKLRKKLSQNKIWSYEDCEDKINISQEQSDFLSELCEYEVLEFNGFNIFISHFIYPDITGSCTDFPKSKKFYKKHFEFLELNNCKINFHGHGHYEGTTICTNKYFKNLPFGNYKIDTFPISISVPCIADSNIENGITIFNSLTYQLNVIPIGKEYNINSKYETIK